MYNLTLKIAGPKPHLCPAGRSGVPQIDPALAMEVGECPNLDGWEITRWGEVSVMAVRLDSPYDIWETDGDGWSEV